MFTTLLPNLSKPARRVVQLAVLAGLVVGASLVIGQSAPPTVELATEPLYMNGAKAKGNLSLALSVEFPTVGQTYRDDFDLTKTYIGYFDPAYCYRHVPGSNYFDISNASDAKVQTNGSCSGGGAFNGNFLNWATSSAIDILRYGLTGGNRVVDDTNTTVVERAWLPDNFYRSNAYFSQKRISKAMAQKVLEQTLYNKLPGSSTNLYIYNCKNRLYFGTAEDTNGSSTCDRPYDQAYDSGSHNYLIGPTSSTRHYDVRARVCDPDSATNRLMQYNQQTKEWRGLCQRYPSGKFKPVGQFQVNSESLRVSVFGYLNDDSNARYGGVLRAPMKYLGPRTFDANFNLVGDNPLKEWNATTGVFIENPQSGDATYGSQGHPRSGAIMYINKFGTLNASAVGDYKTYDPVSELYYEVLRYLQGKGPTAKAVTLTGTATEIKKLKEDFPVYSTWTNPFSGFQDSAGDAGSCLRNSVLAIADVFTHMDHEVPGNTRTQGGDAPRAADTGPALDTMFWTKVVGGFESGTTVAYTDSKGRAQNTMNLTSNTKYPGLQDMQDQLTGAGTGSFHMAGLAYWANTQAFHPTYTKARVQTFGIDVNENRNSDNVTNRRQRQLYLAAKYGGFDDRAANQTGNPYEPGSNILWQGVDGDAKNYFLVSDAQKFLDSIAEVFARVVEETGSIAGGAISTTRLTSSESASVYQARFNPVANFWSGRMLKYPISLATDGNSIVLGSTATWEAGDLLTERTAPTAPAASRHGANRNIVIGPPKGRQGVDNPQNFVWADLPTAHQTALNTPATGVDTLGERRLAWLRGDRRDEETAANPNGIFRTRDMVLGDIVNSGIVFVGKPTLTNSGADFRTFYDTNKTRRSVLYVNANDGMLHGIYDDTGQEAFAYVPGFLSPRLPALTDQLYVHNSIADATPAVGDAYYRGAWRTTLVSGVGGGGQGVYALDITNPAAFAKTNVLWEFTDQDHPAMGNVIGAPQLVKMRVPNSTSTTPTYKWFAVVASGVNNNFADSYALASGNASLFFLDLDFQPSPTAQWVEGTNFWRIELPQTDTTIAKGLVGFAVTKNPATGALDHLYAGDMQGNMWKLDFTVDGTSSLVTSAATNFQTFNRLASDAPLYIARTSGTGGVRQPITGEPTILYGFGGNKVIAFGTGKFLEVNDTSVPLAPAASFYAVLDAGVPIADRTVLQGGTMSSGGTVTVPSFILGTGTATGVKAGWYLDFDATIAERQISDITALGGKILFGSIYPTKGSCGEGGGRLYALDALGGAGTSEESQVGVLAAPLVITMGSTGLTMSDTSGQRTATEKLGVITQGAKGMKPSTLTTTYTTQVGRLSWRQINNYQAKKAE